MCFEIILAFMAASAMGKIADADNRSGPAWFGITLAICFAAWLFIPLPFLRFFIAGIASFILMMIVKFSNQPR